MKIAFGHHLSLSYRAGGERWLTEVANELVCRGHDVSVRCMPIWRKDNKINLLPEINYEEGYTHRLEGDVVYITYHPLNSLNFKTKSPKIGGIHSHCYWQPLSWRYGLLPFMATFMHYFIKSWELNKFRALHTVTPIYPINHENVYFIPNFVDGDEYIPHPKSNEFTVGYASRKVWQKGYDIFLELQEFLEDVQFLTTGDIPQGDMPQFYSKNHVTIVPARLDTFGLVNVESLLCGTPVISSGLPTHKALKLPLRYAHRLSEYIDEINELRGLFEIGAYNEISNSCRNGALRYDKTNIMDHIENMFREVATVD